VEWRGAGITPATQVKFGATFVRNQNGYSVFELKSGRYEFATGYSLKTR